MSTNSRTWLPVIAGSLAAAMGLVQVASAQVAHEMPTGFVDWELAAARTAHTAASEAFVAAMSGYLRAASGADRQGALAVLDSHARAGRSAHEAWSGRALRFCANEWYALNVPTRAEAALELALSGALEPNDRIDALRLRGQVCFLRRDYEQAEQWLAQAVGLCEAEQPVNPLAHTSLTLLAMTATAAGRRDRALEWRTRHLNAVFPQGFALDDDGRASMHALNARDCAAMNDLAGAVTWCDDALARFGNWGFKTGERVGLVLDRFAWTAQDPGDPDHLAPMIRVLNDPRARDCPSTVAACRALATEYMRVKEWSAAHDVYLDGAARAERFASKDPEFSQTALEMRLDAADALLAAGMPADALREYAVCLPPARASLQSVLTGRIESAVDMIEACGDGRPTDVTIAVRVR